MSATITGFKPGLLWKHFDELRKIPHCSKSEKKLGEYIVSVAEQNGLDVERDDVGNVVVRKPAAPGHKNAETVILQGHIDMVCEKNSDVRHDFSKDAIELDIKGEWLYAKGTTLGADNGIGVAAALAVMEDKSLVHGPLELLFTVDEETGLTGARSITPDFLQGRKYLNLDSEEEGVFCIGCAGGGDTVLTIPLQYAKAPAGECYKVYIAGLRGGHSGLDINLGRANALKVLTRLLWQPNSAYDYALIRCEGGNKRNAIAREAFAEVIVEKKQAESFKKRVTELAKEIQFEFKTVEPGVKIAIEPCTGKADRVMASPSQQLLLNTLFVLPHGVMTMSRDIEGLVETSNNVATISCSDGMARIQLSSRSSVMSALRAVRNKLKAFAELAEIKIEQPEGYPAWTPNIDSPLLKMLQKVHASIFKKEAEIKAVHAGLECGIIGEKFPGMDMISFGPRIENPHSPEERAHIKSVDNFWKFLTASLKRLA